MEKDKMPSTSMLWPQRRWTHACSRPCFPISARFLQRIQPAHLRPTSQGGSRKSKGTSRFHRERRAVRNHLHIGATEAINLAIKGYWEANRDRGNHLITVKTEHKAVLATHEYLETLGVEVTYLNVDRNGLISFDELTSNLRPDTLLVSAMHVNNETGIIQDIHRIASLCADQGIAFFTDATQAVAHIPTDYSDDTISLACFSAHKFGGPKGIGALVVKKGITIAPQIHGGGQENGLRSGTYNTPLIVGFGEVCAQNAIKKIYSKQRALIEDIVSTSGLRGHFLYYKSTSPHIINFQIDVDNAPSIKSLLRKQTAYSTGSACNSNIITKSHVEQAMKMDDSELLRFSFSNYING